MSKHPRLVRTGRAVLAIGLGALAGCSDLPGSQPAVAPLGIATRFSPVAEEALRTQTALAQALNQLHVVVREDLPIDALGPILVDRTVTVSDTARDIAVDIAVPLKNKSARVSVEVELLDASTVFFRGFGSLIAELGRTTTTDGPILLDYVGPGANAAILSVQPFQGAVIPSGTVQFDVIAFDAVERQVFGLPVVWSSSDLTIATITSNGLVTSTGKLGTVTITARGLNGISNATTLVVEGAASVFITGGGNQIGNVGTQLPSPFEAYVHAADNRYTADASVTFRAVTGGSVTPATLRSDARGRVATMMTLGTVAGTYVYDVQLTGQPNTVVRITVTAR